jgi:transmembrane sensor
MTAADATAEERRAERRDLAAQQAAEYLLVPTGELSVQRRAELVDWLRESPLHVAEMLRVSRVHAALQACRSWEQHAPDDRVPAAEVVALRAGAPVDRQAAGRGRGRRPALWASAAALAMVIAGAAWLMRTWGQQSFQTLPGERRELTLTDGSIVNLAPASELRVRFNGDERQLWLLRGEAFFQVHKDPQRPFVVAINNMRVRAVGTAFSVRREQQGAVVTVLEGRVSVTNTPPHAAAPARPVTAILVGANEQLRMPEPGALSPVRHVNATVEVAWTVGELIFDDQPVEDVVRRFNAYNRMQIIIDDPQLGARRISGVFRASDPQSFVSFLQSVAGDASVRVDDQLIHVGGAEQGAPAAP